MHFDSVALVPSVLLAPHLLLKHFQYGTARTVREMTELNLLFNFCVQGDGNLSNFSSLLQHIPVADLYHEKQVT
jgi:hypothetical protein